MRYLTLSILIASTLLSACVDGDDTLPDAPMCGERPAMPGLSYGDGRSPETYSVTRSTLDADLVWREQISVYVACLESTQDAR